jgi:sugar phosphate isomerase/epimerase
MHPRISVHAVCFPGAGLRDLAGYWRELGARRVTLIANHFEEGVGAVQQALSAGGDCQVELIVHPFLAGKHLDAGADSWSAARASLSRTIEDASKLGARSIHVMTGGHGALAWEDAAAAFCGAIAPCVAQAKAAKVALVIENASALYADVNITHTLRDTVTLAEMANIGVCLEFFGCWTEAGLMETIERALPRCPIVQVCDYVYGDRSLPSRAVPGDGAIPVKRMIEWILHAGYRGVFDLELIGPRIDREGRVAAVRRAAHNVGEMLTSLGA